MIPEEAFVADAIPAATPVESLIWLMAKAMAEALVPEVNDSTCTPTFPEISSETDLAMAEAWKRRLAVWADCTTLTTTGMVDALPNAALLICTSWSAEVATPLVM